MTTVLDDVDTFAAGLCGRAGEQFHASYQWIGVGAWLAQAELPRTAHLFFELADRQRDCGLSIVKYLAVHHHAVRLEAIGPVHAQYADAIQVIDVAALTATDLAHGLDALAAIARDESNVAGELFSRRLIASQAGIATRLSNLQRAARRPGTDLFTLERHIAGDNARHG